MFKIGRGKIIDMKAFAPGIGVDKRPVSYTHLTLPTTPYV
jgi:hypothetical protein